MANESRLTTSQVRAACRCLSWNFGTKLVEPETKRREIANLIATCEFFVKQQVKIKQSMLATT